MTDRTAMPGLSAEETQRLASKVELFRTSLSSAERAALDAVLLPIADDEVQGFGIMQPIIDTWNRVNPSNPIGGPPRPHNDRSRPGGDSWLNY
jgi:hypothetical protein